jgi:nucleoside-diphosphate-sugar epimerase
MRDLEPLFRGKKAVVTGGAGFVGCHLVEGLLELGAHVVSVDDYSAGKRHNLDFARDKPNFTDEAADVCDKAAMDRILDGAAFVFHNAASKKTVCLKSPQRDLEVNAGGTLNLLELAVKHKVGKFVHASTGSVYGEPHIFPTTEDHPLRPVSYYGVSKLAGERYVDVFHHLYGLDTTILRYFHVYGPRQESNEFGGVVSIFLRNTLEKKPLTIFGDGTQLRSFTWVKDLVRANLLAATTPAASGQVYNCASGIQVTVKDLCEGIVKLAGEDPKGRIEYKDWTVGDIKFFDVSNQKIREHLGIEFERDFWSKMRQTFDEFVEYLRRYELSK